MASIGRNDPCPCGSGKKYKFCCLDKKNTSTTFRDDDLMESMFPKQGELEAYGKAMEALSRANPDADIPSFHQWKGQPNQATPYVNSIQNTAAGQKFSSKADAIAFFENQHTRHNQTALDDFPGLTPEQMHMLLDEYHPGLRPGTESKSDLLRLNFAAVSKHADQVPLLQLCRFLLGYLEQGPIKLTSAGYLPTALVKECFHTVFEPIPFWAHDYIHDPKYPVRRQIDLPILGMLLPVLVNIGLYEEQVGELVITTSGRSWISKPVTEQYEILYCEISKMLDWQDLPHSRLGAPHPQLQQAWNFNNYLLGKKAASWVEPKELVASWLKAFPQVAMSYGINPDNTPRPDSERFILSPLYQLYMVIAWFGFEFFHRALGLIEFKPWTRGTMESTKLRITALFRDLITIKN